MKILIVLALIVFSGIAYGDNLIVSFVLDETGSMSCRRNGTIDSFNEYLSVLKNRPEDISMTLTKFNSEKTEIVFNKANVHHIANLNKDTYNPNNMTPLYDAIGKTINNIKTEKCERVLFVVLTDGLENHSTEYTRKQIFELIENKESEGWTFVFMGADRDSYAAKGIGFQSGNILIWDINGNIGIGTSSPMQQLIKNTCSFLDSGMVQTINFFNQDSVKIRTVK